MKIRLMFKQAVRDFRSKLQLYISFIVFIFISIALILGMLSFNFTIQTDYHDLMRSTLPINGMMHQFRFTSINGNKIDSLKTKGDALYYQVENGDFSKYVFDEILGQDFQLDGDNHTLRKFSDAELTQIYNDVGLDFQTHKNLSDDQIQEKYFTNNIINFMGSNSGYVWNASLPKYQELLQLTDADLKDVFDEFGQIKENLDQNKLRYAAYFKASWFAKRNNRWFSNDPTDQFYDRNDSYSSNLLFKYLLTQKIVTNANGNQHFVGTDTTVNTGSLVGQIFFPKPVDGISGARVAESLLPGEEWMQTGKYAYDWKAHETNIEGFPNWDHIPQNAMRGKITNLKYYDRLDLDKIDPQVLKDGTYAFVNPLFLKQQGLKLGDKISYYSTNYSSGYVTLTIIGTAIAKAGIFNNSESTYIFVPFFQLLRANNFNGILPRDLSLDGFKLNFNGANDFLKEHFYDDFQTKLLDNSTYNSFAPLRYETSEISLSSTTMLFFNLICYSLALMTLLLLFVVFYFITDQSIKLQKNTLKFLKSMGENNWELGLITSISSLVPIVLGTGLGILGSFGTSQILISVTLTSFPFYIPPLSINNWAWLVLLGLMVLIFFMFLGMNIFIIRGPILKLGQNTKIGLVTRGYLAIKPMFKKLPSSTRIGISFIAKNILKNLLTFLLLTISFGVVLFSVQFKYSSDSSAHSFERRYSPYKSVFFDAQNTSDSVKLDLNYLSNLFPDIKQGWENKNLDPLKIKLNQEAYYKGALTTYIDKVGDYRDLVSKDKVDLMPIKSTDKQTGDEQFNELIKHQIDELLNFLDKQIELEPYELNPKYDLKMHYLDREYTYELLQVGSSTQHAQAILNFSDQELDAYAQRIVDMIHKVEQRYQVSFYEGDLLTQSKIIIHNIRDSAVASLADKLETLKTSAIQIKNAFQDFDFKLNLYFNRDLLPQNLNQRGLMATQMNLGFLNVNALGIDDRDEETFKMISNPLKVIEPNNDNFKTLYTYRERGQQPIQVRAMDVYISGNLADRLQLANNDIIKGTMASFAYDSSVSPPVYLRISGIVREASFLPEIYFNKMDLFNYLKVGIEDLYTPISNKITPQVDQTADKDLPLIENRADYAFLKDSLDKMSHVKNGDKLFNNTVFSYTNLPYGISNFALNGNLGSAYSILAYTKLPIFNYASQNYPVNLGSGVYVFSVITERLLKTLRPIINALDKFIILLLLITLAVALILITLILLENKNIILLFKSLGYRKNEVNIYLTLGYIISTILAIILGTTIAYFGIGVASRIVVVNMGISLFFVWSPAFILYALLMGLTFIAMTLTSVTIYTDRQKPKNAFSDL